MLDPFAIASERDYLLLYPIRADALELRWRLTVPGKREAEAAFASHSSPVSAGVLLRRFGGQDCDESGDGALLPVASPHAGRMGLIRLRSDAWYQAELGLFTHDGGWLMLARSNRLALPPEPMGLDCLPPLGRTRPGLDAPAATGTKARQVVWDTTHGSAASSADSRVLARDRSGVPSQRAVEVKAVVDWSANLAPRSISVAAKPEVGVATDPPLAARSGGVAGFGPGGRDRQGPVAGSGPVRSIAEQSEVALWGELRIGGRAAPGSLLDLGGHDYRVGAGGGFAFDLEIRDPDLLRALLRLLPVLPVTPRDED